MSILIATEIVDLEKKKKKDYIYILFWSNTS